MSSRRLKNHLPCKDDNDYCDQDNDDYCDDCDYDDDDDDDKDDHYTITMLNMKTPDKLDDLSDIVALSSWKLQRKGWRWSPKLLRIQPRLLENVGETL